MTAIKFENFYDALHPFCQEMYNDAEVNDAAFGKEIAANISHSIYLTIDAVFYAFAGSVVSMFANLMPGVKATKNLNNHILLKIMDRRLGIRQHEVSPLAMARSMPDALRTQEYADYARSLSLPYIAKVLDSAARMSAPKPTPAL